MRAARAATDNRRSMDMGDTEALFDVPLEVLACSPPARLLKLRSSEWLPFGGRAVRAGVGMMPDSTVLAWMAYARSEDDLACPSWPSQALCRAWQRPRGKHALRRHQRPHRFQR